jgi:hypothetical protein
MSIHCMWRCMRRWRAPSVSFKMTESHVIACEGACDDATEEHLQFHLKWQKSDDRDVCSSQVKVHATMKSTLSFIQNDRKAMSEMSIHSMSRRIWRSRAPSASFKHDDRKPCQRCPFIPCEGEFDDEEHPQLHSKWQKGHVRVVYSLHV